MKIAKLPNFNNCKISVKLFPLLICLFLLLGCQSEYTKQVLPVENRPKISESAVDINSASVAELEKLPGVGAKTAQKIVEFRDKNGGFRRPEHLLLVEGISDTRYREMRNFIKTE